MSAPAAGPPPGGQAPSGGSERSERGGLLAAGPPQGGQAPSGGSERSERGGLSRAWRDGWWPGARHVASPNADERPQGACIDLVVVHSISLPPGEYGGDAVERLFTNRLDCDAHPYYERLRGVRVSSHFFVRRDGAVVQWVSCDRRAWHAGVSSWRGRAACNDFSLGIELEGLEDTPFERAQYDTLARLLRALARRWRFDAVLGHEHIAPGRKRDPGAAFDWDALARAARGPAYWWHDLHEHLRADARAAP